MFSNEDFLSDHFFSFLESFFLQEKKIGLALSYPRNLLITSLISWWHYLINIALGSLQEREKEGRKKKKTDMVSFFLFTFLTYSQT